MVNRMFVEESILQQILSAECSNHSEALKSLGWNRLAGT